MTSNPVILHRGMEKDELEAAQANFKCFDLRSSVPPNSLVVGRYSVLPFYKELEQDLAANGSKLVNSHFEHAYVADLGNWVSDLEDMTPKTWRRLEDVPEGAGPFVLKGATNSRKFNWNTHMFAENKRAAMDVYCRLMDDGLTCGQHIYVRQYVPLRKLMDGFQGMPVTEEYRFFVFGNCVLSGGYYWSNYAEDIPGGVPDPSEVPKLFLQKVVDRIQSRIKFYVIDIARTQSGEWIVIELNDGQMSGLSDNSSDTLYSNLKQELAK